MQVSPYVLHHWTDRLDGLAQVIVGYAELCSPMPQFVLLLDVDALVVGLAGLLQMVRHVASGM